MTKFVSTPKCLDCDHVNHIFCVLGKDKRNKLTQQNTSKAYKKGALIFSEGSYPTGIHIVSTGNIKIVKIGEEGKEQIVRFDNKRNLLGYRSLLGNHVYRASAIAIGKAKVCHIPEDYFLSLLAENHWLYLNLLKKLSNDLAKAEDLILSISQKTVKERVAEAILNLFYKFGCDQYDSIDVKLTRKDIANIAGTTIETTIRTISQLKKEGYIEFNGKKIIVKDVIKLVKLAHYEKLY